ncbi:hypothetical protein [Methylocystis sp.]|uniref:hypothetical protein n=1 Tax=Methylocystis sp. TaxID=1911079 RepID=UPI0025E528E9|nr:hypothetical protein [Methylocystis sp.]
MAVTLKEIEGTPMDWPEKPLHLSKAAKAIDRKFVWQRIEAYIAFRFSPRSIVWIAEGPGYWLPPLSPASISVFDIWANDAWEFITAPPGSPLGGFNLPCAAHYRFSGIVGAAPVPEIVDEAYARLAEYLANVTPSNGVRREEVTDIGSVEYDMAAVARAMERSGAADLLRTYRRPS